MRYGNGGLAGRLLRRLAARRGEWMELQHGARSTVLDRLGTLTDCEALATELAEPLRESAPVNYRSALEHCATSAAGFDCRAYHAVWQLLRLAGVAIAVRVDGPLFVDAAERFARAGRLRHALISGSADYSMLAHLAHGVARVGAAVQFDVVDSCETTLRINRWYAERRGLRLRTFRADVHSFTPDRSYDLICTHSFLPWHPVDRRPALFRRWRDWLAPGGHLCFSNRVTPAAIPFDPHERADRIASMTRRALAKLRELEIDLPCPEPEFVAMMQRFGDRRREEYPELGLDTIRRWIGDAGLVLDICVEVAKVLPGKEDTPFLTGTNVGRPRMWFQARRP